MPFTPLISTETLETRLGDADLVVVDARFSLADPAAGLRAYEDAHVPGARYADLDRDLAGPVVPGVTGRHPLPTPERAAVTFGAWGIDAGARVVAYDDAGGAIAARLWWLLRYFGHDEVAVLDGGWSAWRAEGRPVSADRPAPRARIFRPAPRPEMLADANDVAAEIAAGGCVLDARAAARFRGEVEPIDLRAGHVPGARSAPFAENLGPDGRMRPASELRARYRALLGEAADGPAHRAIAYCGSGVTGAHDLLAIVRAGLPEPRLYAGSWSHWITDPARPVATGAG